MRKHQIFNLQSQVRRMRTRSAQRCQQHTDELANASTEQWNTGGSRSKADGSMNTMAEPRKKHMNGLPID